MKLGIQLWTVRDLTGDEVYKETLTNLAAIGFQGVEFAWKYGGMEPLELSEFLKSVNLECCGLHVQLNELLDPDHKVYQYAAACGSEYITTSLCGRETEFQSLIPKLNDAGSIAQSKGLQFTYHNHHQEFIETVDRMAAQDYLTSNTNPETVGLEIDIGWVKKGGRDPMVYWNEYGNRTPQVHLRDYSEYQEDQTDIGDGFIDLEKIKQQGERLNTKWLIYEQSRFSESSFESCKVCVERGRKAGIIC